jgi:hypothetical protein
MVKIDIGCGPNKKDGFIGIDRIDFTGVDQVHDVVRDGIPFAANEVEEIHCSHFLEHLRAFERTAFINEMWRVMKVGAKATIICPHWSSCRAYGDPTHAWPPVSEFFFFYLNRKWRSENAPHTDVKYLASGYACNFETTWGYLMAGELAKRNPEFQQFALTYYKDAIQDIHATLTKLE